MLELIVSPEADDDLLDIWLRIATDRDTETADRVVDSLHQKFLVILTTPQMGRAREELAPYLRSIPEGNYMIFYRPIMNSVEIVRVVHGRRDIERLFSGGE
ncbi:MAG: type II toxin-antitoxin system RelE/ParE family toxin [Pyrinomonadaceae bacterium]|jgi:toxin ParE1/3/4|nr:type II toxin-antitoxin system RelE/ParE family toxin [Pyrinomonadaceae bacterium]